MEPSTRRGAGAVAILLCGIVLGHCATPGTAPGKTDYKVIHVTHTEEVPGPTVTVTRPPPEACRTAIHIADQIQGAGQQYEQSAAGLLELLGKIRENSVTGDPTTANDIQNELTRLTPRTTRAAEILGSNSTPFFNAATACLKAYKETP